MTDPRGAVDDLFRRLRVERERGSETRGRIDGVGVDVRVRPGLRGTPPSLHVRAELPRGTDLRCLLRRVGEGDLHASVRDRAEAPPRPTGDPDLDGWLELRGDVEPGRVLQWLGPDERRALHALDAAPGLLVERSSLSVLLPVDEPAVQDAMVAALRDAALALDAARARVTVATELAATHATFVEIGAAMGLGVSTCPLGVEGVVDDFDLLVHAPNWGPLGDGVVLVDVARPGPRGATWDMTSSRDGLAWRVARGVLRPLDRLVRQISGEPPSWIRRALHRVRQVQSTMIAGAPREIELPMGFALASAADGRIVAATRLPRTAPEIEACARRLVAVLASAPPPAAADASPFR